jgi:hypothetical protein
VSNCKWCSRCKKFVQVGFVCVCLALEAGLPHTHVHSYLPPETSRVTTVAISTSHAPKEPLPVVGWFVPPST